MMQTYKNKHSLFILQQSIRDFFLADGFLDVQTPPMVSNPGMEPHIHPFRVSKAINKELTNKYLHTSPEFCMKELLSIGFEKIFTQSFCFRDEPSSEHHRAQFIMLEWYRKNSDYNQIIRDLVDLFKFSIKRLEKNNIKINKQFKNFSPIITTIDEIFVEVLGFHILDYLSKDSLLSFTKENLPQVPLPKEQDQLLSWDDLYFLIFLNLIEPTLKSYPFVVLTQFPYHLSSLSSINIEDDRVCNRFELYCFGVEIANCFGELDDLAEQKERFSKDAQIKNNLYNYQLPEPCVLYGALEKGIGESAGIALGVERLLGILTTQENPFYES